MKKYYLGLVLVGFYSLVQGTEDDSVFTWDKIDIASIIRNKCENCDSLDCRIVKEFYGLIYSNKCLIQNMKNLIEQIHNAQNGKCLKELQEKLHICDKEKHIIDERIKFLSSGPHMAFDRLLGYRDDCTVEEDYDFQDKAEIENEIMHVCIAYRYNSPDDMLSMKKQVEMALAKKISNENNENNN